ncbi:2502_t:CDS:2, partial [Gigaspora rosea]
PSIKFPLELQDATFFETAKDYFFRLPKDRDFTAVLMLIEPWRLERNKEKYLPLIEHGYPINEVFGESRQNILRLKENFKNFNNVNYNLLKTILSKKIASEKEKFKANLK